VGCCLNITGGYVVMVMSDDCVRVDLVEYH
jgi:hypothetical protein